ncbi:restriction endonuclease subunit S [Kingella sp. (in: b-proteobacteria)]|uniref:restriction endonuclease subunit S n=1 Tax=Kingella sp. (in: b-proteobacteria) TaxID=2020713 RepID=UPI0026DBA122|nr:restriction endonuclease subunit S [Kingella sp. (in: b-proteobacteria)]MDO4656968.1 restriction endonuclease subunit S [Kingella sp. (in: b-proteobacteria)]
MSDWKIYTISEACKRFSSGKGITASQIFEIGAYPVFGGNGIRGYTDAYNFEGECAIIGRQGAYCGNTKYFCGKAYMTEHAIVATANDEHNIGYIANLLSIMNLGQYQGQSAQPGLSVNTLSKIELKLPDKKTQDSIFSLLSTLDKKIALNKQINARLEQMAKTLYDYWFVQFDFPDADGKPYKSSGGEMVFDETLKRKIPKGWEVKNLGNLAEIVGGSTPSTADSDNFCSNGTAWITPYDLSKNQDNKFISHGEIDVSEKGIKNASLKKYPTGTVLMSSRAPIGYMAIARNEVTTNQGFKSFIPNKGFSKEFVFYAVKNSLKSIMQSASGSTFKEVSATTLHSIQAVFPKHELVEKYTERSKKIFKIQDNLEKQNHQLTQLRDFLLPMLMNGQVSVAE